MTMILAAMGRDRAPRDVWQLRGMSVRSALSFSNSIEGHAVLGELEDCADGIADIQ